jgi:hypothetical protein
LLIHQVLYNVKFKIGLVLAAGALRWYAKLQGEADSEDSEEWNQKLSEDQKGNEIN